MRTTAIATATLAWTVTIIAFAVMTVMTRPVNADPSCNVIPDNLSASLDGDSTAVVLTWTTPEDCTPDTYAIYRRVLSQESRVRKIDTVDGSATSFTDTNTVAAHTHRYRIKSQKRSAAPTP